MQQPQPQVAFIAAAIALLVLPLLVLFGLSALGLAAGMLGPVDRLDGAALWLVLAAFAVWSVLVVAAVLVLISLIRRTATRS